MMLVTHRGPFGFAVHDDGRATVTRGAGGVVSALLPLLDEGVNGDDAVTWIAAAIGDGDYAAAERGLAQVPGVDLTLLAPDRAAHHLHYDVVSNGTLWYLHHGLFDLPRTPVFDEAFRAAWDAYRDVNEQFASAVVELARPGEAVLVHDYHLALVPGFVRDRRDDLRVVHFTHTPFCGPNSIRVLPNDVATALCRSMASVPAGFHTVRWAQAYDASVRVSLGPESEPPFTFASPLGPDRATLEDAAASPDAIAAAGAFDALAGDRKLILRTDRIDPSKNIVRGFRAYDHLFEQHPEWRERVVFLARLTSSRETLPEYVDYHREVDEIVARVNERWARGDWQPIVVETADDYHSSVAGFTRYDVLMVNPVKDGLNLVAKEGPLVNRRDGVVVLSPEAGSYDELRDAVVPIHPFDVAQGSAALHCALTMAPAERARRANHLRALVERHTPHTWIADLLSYAR